MNLLEGRAALVTGAGRGIGAAVADRLAAEGASVAVNDVDEAAAAKVVRRLADRGATVVAVPGDVSVPQTARSIVRAAATELGGLAILVNNAGIESRAKLRAYPESEWHRVIAVNLSAPFFLSQAAVDLLVASGHGAVVNICSVAVNGASGQPAYDASKGGLLTLTRSLAVELGPEGVRVNAVCPGIIDTPMLAELLAKNERAEGAVAKRIEALPLPRLGSPDDIAAAVAWLASDEARYVTGHALFVDGGWVRA